MKILFAFENPLPSAEADAEVFVSTARHLAGLAGECWLHVPVTGPANHRAVAALAGMTVIAARAPRRPAVLRHFLCGLTLPWRKEFRQADLVYTRNLWVAWMAILAGQRVVFDHYRPWPEQVPPLQLWLYHLFCHPRFLTAICHSAYTLRKYQELGIPSDKLVCIHNGFEPARFAGHPAAEDARRQLGIDPGRKTVVYTGRINHKKGLGLVVEAARRLPGIQFLLVGSYGEGPIEKLARGIANIRIVPFQPAKTLMQYIAAADLLLIPPSLKPLAEFGSTVLPLKLFLYLAAGRPILAGNTPDVREVLRHGRNAFLCRPDDVVALAAGIETVTGDDALAGRLAAAAEKDSRDFTWPVRAGRIAALVSEKLSAAPAPKGFWNRTQSAAWIRQSRRWLVHLIRTRSVILPQGTLLPAPSAPQP